MRVYAMIKYGVAGKVERNPGMYGQRRQANTEMRHHLGHPSEGHLSRRDGAAQRPMAAVGRDAKKYRW